MSASKLHQTDRIGFSTGALERGNFFSAVKWMQREHIKSIELSALRMEELKPLVDSLDSLPTNQFQYVSFHAPSSFPKESERHVVQLLKQVAKHGWNIIVHPDVIRRPALWRQFGKQLLIENMDRRKSVGRTVGELDGIFKKLPEARLCLDVAHARQLDTTLTLLSQIIGHFAEQIAEIHISELDSFCQHKPMSSSAVYDYQKLSKKLNRKLPVIIESVLDENSDKHRLKVNRLEEFELAFKALNPEAMRPSYGKNGGCSLAWVKSSYRNGIAKKKTAKRI